MKRMILLGLGLTALHFAAAILCVMIAFNATIGKWDQAVPLSPLERAAGILADILTQPLDSLWTPWMSQHMPNSVENALFVANSALWGFGIAWLMGIRRRSKARLSGKR